MITRKQTMKGTVISDKMDKTALVEVLRRIKNSRVEKYIVQKKKYKAHDEKNECHTGDWVLIRETAPISREKRWAVIGKLKKAGEVP